LGHRGATTLALALAVAGLALSGAPALAASPLTFSAPVPIDTNSLTGVSCPSTTLCVAVDSAGNVIVSNDPIGGAATWKSASVNPPNAMSEIPGGFTSVSCPSMSFCIAVGAFGQAATSTNPAVLSTWQLIPMGIDEPETLTGVSCSSPTRCVAVDNAGYAVTTDVAEGQPLIWTRTSTPIDTETTNISGVSCVSTDLCVAVDTYGDAITATQVDPSGWNDTVLIEPQPHTMINGVSCASVTLCAAVDVSGSVLVSTNPRAISPTWTPVQVEGSYLTAVACVSGPLCIAVDGSGRATVSSDPAGGLQDDWFGPTRIDPASGTSTHSLTAVSCPSAVECVAVDQAGNVVVGSVQYALTVALAGSGSGTVTGPAINCPTTCTSSYLGGTAVPLIANAAKGSTFSGWSGGCHGSGACTATLSSDETVTATFTTTPPGKKPPPSGSGQAPDTVITSVKTNSHRRSATFRFHAVGVSTGLQCAIVRQPKARRHHKHPRAPKPRFSSCRSPKAYKHLKAGRYVFSVRAHGPGGTDRTPARRAFKIS
jgi:hypothetical protein